MLQTALQPAPVQPTAATSTMFARTLQQAGGATAATPFAAVPASAGGTPAGQAMLNVVRPEVDDVYAWAQRTGQGDPAGSGPPLPGDLIVWDEHIGVVESLDADGTIHAIECNSSDRVS